MAAKRAALPQEPERPAEPQLPQRKKKRKRGGTLLLVIGIVIAIIGGGVLVWSLRQDANLPKDMAGNPVQLQGETLDPNIIAQMQVQDGTEGQLRVPSVNLDVPLGSMLEVNGEITPPGFTEAYWVRNRGVNPNKNPADGTSYVVAHSVHKGIAPGNYLFDVNTGQSKVKAGDQIYVGSATYTAQKWQTVDKPQLPTTTDIWAPTPDRLILITCLEEPSGYSPKNFIITATLNK